MERSIVSASEWTQSRVALLEKEKEFTKIRDSLAKKKRELPWVHIDKAYTFQGVDGPVQLSDLFRGKSQLIVYHFMFGPNQSAGCKICSHWADQFDPAIPHLRQRDVNMVCISRGGIHDLLAYKEKMNWSFEWVSSANNTFNFDFQASALGQQQATYNYKHYTAKKDSELPGISVFYRKDDGSLYHTYSCYARELETFNVSYRFLDIVPKGRDESDLPWPMSWVDLKTNY